MISLFLNTSVDFLSVAIVKDDVVLDSFYTKLNNDLSKINTTVTYDEQLSESENDQYTLTFSMPRYLEYRGTTPQYNY